VCYVVLEIGHFPSSLFPVSIFLETQEWRLMFFVKERQQRDQDFSVKSGDTRDEVNICVCGVEGDDDDS
jgi:hypothetical protein